MAKPKVEVGRWESREQERSESTQQPVANLEALAWILDSSIKLPGTKFRVGVDALIGLVPVVGDLIGAALSSYILIMAAKLGVPRVTLLRMGFNVTLEALVGLIPFVGDLFDFFWKANRKNVELLKAHLQSPKTSRRSDWVFAVLFILGVILLVCALAWGTVSLFAWLRSAFTG